MAPALSPAKAGVLRKLLALTIVALAVGVAGGWMLFERDGDDGVAAAGWNTCVNPLQGFSIDYPAAWYTDHPAPEFACLNFHPRPFEFPREGDPPVTALQVMIATPVSNSPDEPMQFEAQTGGLMTYGYRVSHGDGELSVFTTSNRGVDFTPWKRIVDRAVETLVLGEAGDRPLEGAELPLPQDGLPEPVARKRAEIWSAARRKDYDALARLVDPGGFSYTFGGPVPGGPAAYWRRLEPVERPVEILGAILELPYAYQPESKLYVWPDAFTRKASMLSIDEKEELAEAIGEQGVKAYEELDSYLGYRAGIDAEGNWVFYVAGD